MLKGGDVLFQFLIFKQLADKKHCKPMQDMQIVWSFFFHVLGLPLFNINVNI